MNVTTASVGSKELSAKDAAAYRKRLQKIERKHAVITPEAVVEDASDESSPLHNWFEWDDTEAAAAYRLVQARELIRFVKVEIIAGDAAPVTVRAFVHCEESEGYRSVENVMAHRQTREELLAEALEELQAFKEKYATLKELAAVFGAIEKTMARKGARDE